MSGAFITTVSIKLTCPVVDNSSGANRGYRIGLGVCQCIHCNSIFGREHRSRTPHDRSRKREAHCCHATLVRTGRILLKKPFLTSYPPMWERVDAWLLQGYGNPEPQSPRPPSSGSPVIAARPLRCALGTFLGMINRRALQK